MHVLGGCHCAGRREMKRSPVANGHPMERRSMSRLIRRGIFHGAVSVMAAVVVNRLHLYVLHFYSSGFSQ